jgi:hypothetical protein
MIALLIRHVMRMRLVLLSVARLDLPHSSTFSHKGHDLRKEIYST